MTSGDLQEDERKGAPPSESPVRDVGPTHVVELLDVDGKVTFRHPVADGTLEIGRGYRSDIVVDDPFVCLRHARLTIASSEVQIENLSEVNGIADEKGASIDGTKLGPDEIVRLASIGLRVRPIDYAAPPAKVYSRRPAPGMNIGWLRAGMALVALLALAFWESWSGSIRYLEWEETLLMMVSTVVGVSVWAGLWALASRIFRKRNFFLEHLGILCVGLLAIALWNGVSDLVLFWVGADQSAARLSLIVGAVATAAMLGAHLSLVGRRPRWGFSAVVALVIIALGLVVENSGRDEFQYYPSHNAQLKPLPASWLQTSSLDEVFSEAEAIRDRLDEEVQEELDKKLAQEREREVERAAQSAGRVSKRVTPPDETP